MPPLKPGDVADSFGNYAKGKDQSRVTPGNPNTPVLTADQIADGAVQRKRRVTGMLAGPTTRLKDVNP